MLTKPCLHFLAGLSSPAQATVIARVRLVTQLCRQAPLPVREIFEAAWNRATVGSQLLVDACGTVLYALPGLHDAGPIHLRLVQQHAQGFLRACQHLSRYGTVYWSFWDLWRDVGQPRRKKVLGALGSFSCPICQVALPSHQALAAHVHRKHTVVNFLTRFTSGTVCLWCHTEQFSTDRLKYHLRRSPMCLHGLRVTVGECYTYGTGSRRTGCRGHRGLPPIRLPGPLNATPAMRAAAAEGRPVTDAELRHELFVATGSHDVMQWPAAGQGAAQETVAARGLSDAPLPRPVSLSPTPLPSSPNGCVAAAVRWRCFCDSTTVGGHLFPSPRWEGLRRELVCWGVPSAWHRYWTLWSAADTCDRPWDFRVRGAQRLLRTLASADASNQLRAFASLAANTIIFKQVCIHVCQRGMLWIQGVPSSTGLKLLRRLLPSASFHILPLRAGRVFAAEHPSFDVPRWSFLLSSVVDSLGDATAGAGFFLQPALIYHPGSPDRG